MLLLGAICWDIWNVRNKITSNHLVLSSSMVTIAFVCALLKFWAGLYGVEDGDKIRLGANQILHQTSRLSAGASNFSGMN
jgi:hypothetical protein